MNEVHECVKDASFREMTGEFKVLTEKVGGLCTDIALVKKDVGDLKQVTMVMSDCIKALTETSIKAGENNITRAQFFVKIDELTSTRQQMIDRLKDDIRAHEAEDEKRIDELAERITTLQEIAKDYVAMKKVGIGILTALIIMVVATIYQLAVGH